jgi:16S rRNA (uracil1498-N3)-methyltransferase
MDYFYAPPDRIDGTSVLIDGEELSHLVHVMRKKEGDEIMVVDGEGSAYDVVLEAVTKRSARGLIRHSHRHYHEPASRVTLAVGILKNPSKFDFLVEKATEVGVIAIIPLRTERTIPAHAKIDRWQKLALAAMKQSGRSYLPRVKELISLEELVRTGTAFQRRLIAHSEAVAPLPAAERLVPEPESTLILVGPEGGFSESEVSKCVGAGFRPVYLGERRLRTETASIALATLAILGRGLSS